MAKKRGRKTPLANQANRPVAQLELPDGLAARKKTGPKSGNSTKNDSSSQVGSGNPQPSRTQKRRLREKMAAQKQSSELQNVEAPVSEVVDGRLLFPENYKQVIALSHVHCGWNKRNFGNHPVHEGRIGARIRDAFHPIVGASVASINQQYQKMCEDRKDDMMARHGIGHPKSLSMKFVSWPHNCATPMMVCLQSIPYHLTRADDHRRLRMLRSFRPLPPRTRKNFHWQASLFWNAMTRRNRLL